LYFHQPERAVAVARSCDAPLHKVGAMPSSRDKPNTPFGWAAGGGDEAYPHRMGRLETFRKRRKEFAVSKGRKAERAGLRVSQRGRRPDEVNRACRAEIG